MKISQARGAAWAKAQGWESPRHMEDPPQPEVGYPEKDAGRFDWKSTCGAEDLTYMAMGSHRGFCAGAAVVQRMKQEQMEVARMQGEPGWEVGLRGQGAAPAAQPGAHTRDRQTQRIVLNSAPRLHLGICC